MDSELDMLRAFTVLIDSSTSTFKLPLTSQEARQALRDFDVGARATVKRMSDAMNFSSSLVILQGGCILYAFLEKQGWLRSVWTGPVCALSEVAIKTMQDFRKQRVKVLSPR